MRKDVFATAANGAVRAGLAATIEAPTAEENEAVSAPGFRDTAPVTDEESGEMRDFVENAPRLDRSPRAVVVDDEPLLEQPEPSKQDLSATDDAPLATGRHSVTHNKHDVGALEAECNQLSAAIAQMGAQLDAPTIQQRAQSYAAMKLLVDRGICTEAEAQAAVLLEIRSMLADILQQVEVQRMQQQQGAGGPQVQAVRKPDLLLPNGQPAAMMRRRHQD